MIISYKLIQLFPNNGSVVDISGMEKDEVF